MRKIIVIIFVVLLTGCVKNHNPKVRISTEAGHLEAELLVSKAPLTAGNLLRCVD